MRGVKSDEGVREKGGEKGGGAAGRAPAAPSGARRVGGGGAARRVPAAVPAPSRLKEDADWLTPRAGLPKLRPSPRPLLPPPTATLAPGERGRRRRLCHCRTPEVREGREGALCPGAAARGTPGRR